MSKDKDENNSAFISGIGALAKLSSTRQPQDASQDVEAMLHQTLKVGWRVLAFGFVFFVLWASLVSLDEGVPFSGTVVIETKRKTLQHMQGGIVSDVLVKEGQWVQKGDELLRLDATSAQANYETAKQNLAGQKETLLAQEALLVGLVQGERMRLEQKKLLEREQAGLVEVVKEGYAPQVQLYQLERSIADVNASLADIQANQKKTKQTILEIRHQLLAAEKKLASAQTDLGRMQLFANVSGQVVGMNIQSPGAVIQPAEKILDIVPENESLVIEAKVNPQYVDRLRIGDKADVRFSSFAHSPLLVAQAELLSVSGDVLMDPVTHQPYYLARLALTEQGLRKLGGRDLQAGMAVEVVLLTGERTMLSYLLHPLTKRLAATMKEQ